MASNSYYAKTYDEWKKKWGVDAGTKVEGMTDNDFALGLYLQGQDEQSKQADSAYNATQDSLFRQYQSGANSLNQAYNANLSQLDASKKTSEQNADILHQKMQKYLGTQADAAGMSGTGYASPESLKLRANAAYNQNLGNIAANYNTNKTSLDTAKLSGLSDLENAYMTGEEQAAATRDATKAQIAANNTNKLLSMYSDEAAANKAEADKAEADIEDSYDTYAAKALSAINNTNMKGAAALEYLDSIKDNLRAEDYAYLKSMADAKIAKEQTESEETGKSYTEAAYDTAYNNAVSMINYVNGTDALAYVDENKASFRDDDYKRLRLLALQKVNDENKNTEANASAESQQKLAQAYSDFVTAYNAGAFASTNDAMAWLKDNGIENYSIAKQLANTIDVNNKKAADATAEADKTQAQISASNYVSNSLQYAQNGDDAYAMLDRYKDQLTQDDYNYYETIIKSAFGERGAMTLEKFKAGEAINGFVYKKQVTENMLEETNVDKKFKAALESKYGTKDPEDVNLKNGDFVTFDARVKGSVSSTTARTYMYYDGAWYEVMRKPFTSSDTSKIETAPNILQQYMYK